MGFLDRLLGKDEPRPASTPRSGDEQAIARYRYLLRTAPPEAVEQAHAEAFAQLTPEQRQQVLSELSRELPVHERPAGTHAAEPQALARMATRAELRQPGFLERTLGPRPGMGGGVGFGGMLAGSLLGSIAGTFIGTAIAEQFLGGFDGSAAGGDAQDADAAAEDAQDEYAAADETEGDFADDFGGGDDFDV